MIWDSADYNLGRSLQANMSSIILHSQRRWPRMRKRATQLTIAQSPPNLMPEHRQDDFMSWLPHPSGVFFFPVSSYWNSVRHKFPDQNWHTVFCGGKHMPRWTIILRLAARQGLSTSDRLSRWGLVVWWELPLAKKCKRNLPAPVFWVPLFYISLAV